MNIVSRLFSKMKIVSRLFSEIVLRVFSAVAPRAFWAIGGDDNFGRQFWATILIINWVATAVLSGPRLGSEALLRCSLRDEQLVPPPSSQKVAVLGKTWQIPASTSHF